VEPVAAVDDDAVGRASRARHAVAVAVCNVDVVSSRAADRDRGALPVDEPIAAGAAHEPIAAGAAVDAVVAVAAADLVAMAGVDSVVAAAGMDAVVAVAAVDEVVARAAVKPLVATSAMDEVVALGPVDAGAGGPSCCYRVAFAGGEGVGFADRRQAAGPPRGRRLG
jgi:hypothetical protein